MPKKRRSVAGDASNREGSPKRAPIIFVRPPKPIKEMTQAEFNDWSEAVYNEMCDRIRKAKGKTEGGPAKP